MAKENKTKKQVVPNVTIEGARILFRNFRGEASTYNAKGRRNFCVILDPDLAFKLSGDGWNVKTLKPRDEEDEPQSYMQVKVVYGSRPPKIVILSGNSRTEVDEETVGMLDWAEIENVDLTIRPYEYDVNGRTGISAYLKSMYVTLVDDYLEQKYSDCEHHICNHDCANCKECNELPVMDD